MAALDLQMTRDETGKRVERTIRAVESFLAKGRHLALGLGMLLISVFLARFHVAVVETYFYAFAWYSLLLVLDAWLLLRIGVSLILHRPLALLSLLAWSVPFWLLFEAMNLRIENWYYVNVPAGTIAARLFMIVSFATVLPGIVYIYLLLDSTRWLWDFHTKKFRCGVRGRRVLFACGIACATMPLLAPNYAYPLVWCFVPLLLEPLNRRPRWSSLLREFEFGWPRRTILLLVAGMLAGAYWELMNVPATTKWIYTVPFFDRTLNVEMPLLGFLGFAPFALSAYSFLRFLESRGLSVPFEPIAERAPVLARMPTSVRVFLLPALVAFLSFAVVPWMERETIDSRVSLVRHLKNASRRDRAILSLAGLDRLGPFLDKAKSKEGREEIAKILVATGTHVDAIISEAKLAKLRGIGAANARLLMDVGVTNVAALADRDPNQLYTALRALGSSASSVKPQRVREWVRGARDELVVLSPSR